MAEEIEIKWDEKTDQFYKLTKFSDGAIMHESMDRDEAIKIKSQDW